MNAIEIIKQNAKMWLGPKYSNKEYEIFKEGIEPLCKRLIKEIRKANNEENKAPRTGFPKPTEKEKKEFEKMIKCKKCKCKKVRSSRGLVCPKHEIK